MTDLDLDIFLDSGAFGAKYFGLEYKVEDYADFLDHYSHTANTIASLDSIPADSSKEAIERSVKLTYENAVYLRDVRGHDVIPVYHYGEDPQVVYRFLDAGFEYIGIGGSAKGKSRGKRTKWLTDLFTNWFTDSEGRPIAKFHGFGVAGKDSFMFPWRSCDSTSAIVQAGCRTIMIPTMRNGKLDYSRPSGKVNVVTDKSKVRIDSNLHDDWDITSSRDSASYFRMLESGKDVEFIDTILEDYYGVKATVPPQELSVMTMRVIALIYLRKLEEQIKEEIAVKGRIVKSANSFFKSGSDYKGHKVTDYTYYACTGTPDSHITRAIQASKITSLLLSYFDLSKKHKNNRMDQYWCMLETGIFKGKTDLSKYPVQLEYL